MILMMPWVACGMAVTQRVMAAVEPGEASAARGLGEIESLTATALPAPQGKRHTLRCWQKGYLIVERTVAAPPAEAERSVPVATGKGEGLRLYDLQNALCVIE